MFSQIALAHFACGKKRAFALVFVTSQSKSDLYCNSSITTAAMLSVVQQKQVLNGKKLMVIQSAWYHPSFITIHCCTGNSWYRWHWWKFKKKTVTVKRPHITMLLFLCFHAAVCQRSSWLKGTKPHRNTWLGSVWPATARRAASAARARESEREGFRGEDTGKRKEMTKMTDKQGGCHLKSGWRILLRLLEHREKMIFNYQITIAIYPYCQTDFPHFFLLPTAVTLHPPPTVTAPHLPSLPFWMVLRLL